METVLLHTCCAPCSLSCIDSLREETQLIMITHQRRTMEMADTLFGVSMQGDGVTKVISQKLDQALKHAE